MPEDDFMKPVLSVQRLTVTAAGRTILRDVDFDIPRRMVTSIIGPSGAGKSTLLKCLNRLIDLSPSLQVEGRVLLDGDDVRGKTIDVDDLRRRIGMVFQQPVIFPGSIEKNVLFAVARAGNVPRSDRASLLESVLTQAGLWTEVRDRLHETASTLSVGQQQRLAIARTLAGHPDVVLMDEPTSALDPRSVAAIEETIVTLKSEKTIVLVTHHLEQARRLSDWVACICPIDGAGQLTEADRCETVFCCPSNPETGAYLGVCVTEKN